MEILATGCQLEREKSEILDPFLTPTFVRICGAPLLCPGILELRGEQ